MLSTFRYLYIICLNFVMVCQVAAQFTATARLDTTSMLIGDTMRLHLRAETADNWRISDDGLGQLDSMKQLEKQHQTDWQKVNGAYEKSLTFTIYDSGYYWIPSLNITFEQGGQTATARTNSLALAVYYPKTDTSLIEIKDISRTPLTWQDAMPYVALVLGILVGIQFFSWFFSRRKKKKEIKEIAITPLTPAELALKKMAALRQSGLWRTDVKAFYIALTYILRAYMEDALQIPALESTAEDIIQKLPQMGISLQLQNDLRHFFVQADLAKFANHNPPESLHEPFITVAEQLVAETIPAPTLTEPTIKVP